MIERIFDWQLKIMFALGIVCAAIIFTLDFRGMDALLRFLMSFSFAFLGQKFYQAETAESWMKFSYGSVIKNIFGAVFLLLGWMIFLRGVFALAISVLILQASK